MTLKKFSTSFLTVAGFLAVIVVASLSGNLGGVKTAEAANVPVTGYAWSDNVGWILFDTGRSSPVMYEDSTGQFSGYAWSDNIGWVSFNSLSASGGVGGLPAKADYPLNTTNNTISGWARACAGTTSATCSTMISRTDGWDGWMRFDTGKLNSAKIDLVKTSTSYGDLNGYVWGGDVVGWISLNCKEGGPTANSICSTSNYKVHANLTGSSSSSSSSYRTLTVSRIGTGTGTVVSNPSGIDCGGDCSESYPQQTGVTLTATPSVDSKFVSWNIESCPVSGSCYPVNIPTCVMTNLVCTLTVGTNNVNVTAKFEKTNSNSNRTLKVKNSSTNGGAGYVLIPAGNSGISENCGRFFNCEEEYSKGTLVTLTAYPETGTLFTWLSGCDTTNGNSCIVTMSADKTVEGNFKKVGENLLSVNVLGNGTVWDSYQGINCGSDCSELYSPTQWVGLYDTPKDSLRAKWEGCDNDSANEEHFCIVEMSTSKTITATFDEIKSEMKTLIVAKDGTGTGLVSVGLGENNGIYCGENCVDDYEVGTSVTLFAEPDGGSQFVGWSGVCEDYYDGRYPLQCDFVMPADDNPTVTATFNTTGGLGNNLIITIKGKGTVSGSFGSDCINTDEANDKICNNYNGLLGLKTLNAKAPFGWAFTGWTQDCSSYGIAKDCSVNMNTGNKNVTATFSKVKIIEI